MARPKRRSRNDNNLAIAYYRYSSASQNETSIDQQREAAQVYAARKGYKIVHEYVDAAQSGRSDQRPGFQRMLAEVDTLRPSTLILWKSDRLGRDFLDVATARKTLRDAGCAVEYVSEDTPDADTRWGLLVQTLNDIQAQEYSDNLSMNIRRGNAYAAENCFYLGREIFGYKGEAGHQYEIDPQTAPFVARLFREYADGKRLQVICNEMNAAGLRTVRGNPFRVETLRKMLKNEAYLGVYQFGDVRVEGGMPALVDQATFDAVQQMFAKNRYRTGRYPLEEREDKETRYWLSEKLICGECGGPMQGLSGTSKTGRKYTYYACKNMREKACSAKAVRQLELEDVVTEALRHILSNTENLASLAVDMSVKFSKQAETGVVDSLKASLVEVTRRLDNVVKAVVEHGIVSSSLQDQLTSLETQKGELERAIEVEELKQSIAQKDTSILAFFNEWVQADFDDPGVRETLLGYFVDSMTWKDGRLRLFGNYYESPPDALFNPLDVEVDGESINFPNAENALKGFASCVLGSTISTQLWIQRIEYHSSPSGSVFYLVRRGF